MRILGIKTPLIEPSDDIDEVILNSVKSEDSEIKVDDGDILVIASSAISTTLGEIKELEKVDPTERARSLAKEANLDEDFTEVVIQEADMVLETFEKCILSLKNGMIRINAGVDRTNIPKGKVLTLPKDSEKVAKNIKKNIESETGKDIGVVISDSHVNPLRRGTTGQAIGTSGIEEVVDCRDQSDLYDRRLQITFRGIGDQLAAAAQLVMGEADERIPAVLVKGAESFLGENGKKLKIPPDECAYGNLLDYNEW